LSIINKKTFFLVITFLVICSFSFQGCGCGGDDRAGEKASGRKILRLAIPSDITTIDPAFSTDVTSGQILSKVYERLVNLDDNMIIKPDLAETFEISADCKEFKFTLRRGVLFSDGVTVLNSKMVKDSFERVINPKTASPRANIFDKIVGYDEFIAGKTSEIEGLKTNSDYEIVIKIKQPFVPFLYNLSMVPASIVSVKEKDPIGTGPFFIAQKSDGAKMTLGKNSFYYMKDRIFIDELVYNIIHDENTQITSFEIGNIDVLNLSTVNVNNFMVKNGSKYNIHKQPKLNVYYIAFNCANKMFESEKVRKALNYAINKEEIIKVLMNNTMIPSVGPFPPSLGSFDQKASGYSFDIDKAKTLLKEANVQNLNIDLYFKSSFEIENIMQMVKENLAKVGVNVSLKKMEWAALKSEIVKGNLPMYYLNWSADYPDSHNFLVPLYHTKNKGAGGNRAFFSDKSVDDMMDKLEATSNPDEYKKLSQEIQKVIIDKAPWIFLWHEIEYAASQKNVVNYNVPKIYSMEKFLDVKLTE